LQAVEWFSILHSVKTDSASPARPVTADTVAALAHTIRFLRGKKRWTLAALAARSGVSRGMLLQMEAARTNPSIGTLIQIANAFGVGVWQLFSAEEQKVKSATAAEALTLWRSRRGSTGTLLVGVDQPQPVELWLWAIAPGDGYDAAAHLHNTLEIIHVTKGTLTLTVGARHYQVPARGSIIARMDERHRYTNGARSWLHLTMTVVDPAR
jgi:transcriptional regulator with XRE-family HTH domain